MEHFSCPMKRHYLWFEIGRCKKPVRKLRLINIVSEQSHVLLKSRDKRSSSYAPYSNTYLDYFAMQEFKDHSPIILKRQVDYILCVYMLPVVKYF